MASDPNILRRVSRFENDVVSIYELIDHFRSEVRDRFDGIETRLTGSDTRLDRIETTLTEVLRRLPDAS